MINTRYHCRRCDLAFERTTVETEQAVKCPCCGGSEIDVVTSEIKEPQSCAASSRYS